MAKIIIEVSKERLEKAIKNATNTDSEKVTKNPMIAMMKLLMFTKFKFDIEKGIDEINVNEDQIDSESSENIFEDIILNSLVLSSDNKVKKTEEEDYKDKEE